MKVQSRLTSSDPLLVEEILRGSLILKQHDYWYAIQQVVGPELISSASELHEFPLVHTILAQFQDQLPDGVYFTDSVSMITPDSLYGLALNSSPEGKTLQFLHAPRNTTLGYWFKIKRYRYGS